MGEKNKTGISKINFFFFNLPRLRYSECDGKYLLQFS